MNGSRVELAIGDRRIGAGHPCFVVGEAGVNHNGCLDLARQLVDVAVDAGVDAVKFQTFVADELVTADASKADYQRRITDAGESQLEMLRRLELPAHSFAELQAYCRHRGILFLSTPFDEASADLLHSLDVPLFKVSSGDLNNVPLLTHLARMHRPLVLSTGMATLGEIESALVHVRTAGDPPIALLHCVSDYPARPADVNLRAMATLRTAFSVPVGFSDHTVGIEVGLAAVAMGASILEKHFTLDRAMEGPDHAASLDPEGLKRLVASVRTVEAAFGDGVKLPAASERSTARAARRSLVAARDLAMGERLDDGALAVRRPGTGLSPELLPYVVGRRLRCPVSRGSLISLDMLE
jgi:N,N'-diacetyllegionaminate synthase